MEEIQGTGGGVAYCLWMMPAIIHLIYTYSLIFLQQGPNLY